MSRRRKQTSGPKKTFESRLVITPGLEAVLAEELRELGFSPRVDVGGATVSTDIAGLYRLNVACRTASRVVVRVGEVGAGNLDALAAAIRRLDWAPWVHPGQPVVVKATIRRSRHRSNSVEAKVKHAIGDALRGPRVSRGRPPRDAVTVQVLVQENRALVSIDASGDLLHFRGWKRNAVPAPIRENLAAALLRAAGWHAGEALLDPMCGSGTFPIEAAHAATGRLPGARRDFALERFPCAVGLRRPTSRTSGGQRPLIFASDRAARAVAAARSNASRAGVDWITVQEADFRQLEPPRASGLVVMNPPYGKRIGGDVSSLYRAIGHAARTRWARWRMAIVVPVEHVRDLACPGSEVVAFRNGGIRVVWWVTRPA